MEPIELPSRRRLLGAVGASGLLCAAPALAETAERSPEIGRKFLADGRVHPFAGNTVICHLPQQGPESALFDGLLDMYRELPQQGFHGDLAVLPPSSYHMTVFGCANDADRRPERWPKGIAADASIEACTRLLAGRLEAARLPDPAPIHMRIDPSDRDEDRWTMRLVLVPASEADARALGETRDRLAEIVGIRGPDHDRYTFHVTIGYWLRRDTAQSHASALYLSAWRRRLSVLAPVVVLGTPEFCFFKDMFAFHRRAFIA